MLLSLTGAWRNVRSLPEATANGLGTPRHNIETIHAKCRARICQGCYNCVTVGKLVLIAFLGRGKRNLTCSERPPGIRRTSNGADCHGYRLNPLRVNYSHIWV